ncbi:MAG TPA: hypothetical protein VF121_05705 [Thermoanaerobaculia bacterium]|nr:hypothetical protein [Thermoanaerobaculia bacterium]
MSRTPFRVLFALALATAVAAPAAAEHIERLRMSFTNRLASTAEAVGITVSGYSECPVQFPEPVISGRSILLEGSTIVTILPCVPAEWSQSFALPRLPVGGYTVEVWIDFEPHLLEGFAVQAASPALSFHGGAFSATAAWKNGTSEGEGQAVQLAEDSGAFWFFGPRNVEVTIKVLDGRSVNGHWWVFIANMSDVDFTILVTECPTNPLLALPCRSKAYRNPPGKNRNFIDTSAF